jgi:ubiquinone biosynthesis protein UbiJ
VTTAGNPIEELLASLATTVSNATLGLDPSSAARLAALEGKCLRLEIEGPGRAGALTNTLLVRGGTLEWCSDHDAHRPNVIVTGPLPDIAALLLDGASRTDGRVTIDGDETLLADFGGLLKHFEPDLAAPVGQVLGRELADNLVGLAEAGIAFVRSAGETLEASIRDSARAAYLGDDDFALLLEQMDELRLRTDRLRERVHRLESAHGE